MNINNATPKQITTFIGNFINEKDLDKSDFEVIHPFYSKTEMPFSVVKDGLTSVDQNIHFLRAVAKAISALDFQNASKEKIRKFFQDVADEMITFV